MILLLDAPSREREKGIYLSEMGYIKLLTDMYMIIYTNAVRNYFAGKRNRPFYLMTTEPRLSLLYPLIVRHVSNHKSTLNNSMGLI